MDMPRTQVADTISRRAVVSLVSQLLGDYPNPEDPNPPGPWGPVIHRALERVRATAGPFPEPWVAAALNPQPLPPRARVAAALAEEVIDRMSLLQDVADALPGDAQSHMQEAIGRRLTQFIDDCGNGRIPFPGPFPGPPQGDGAAASMGPAELVVMGVQFQNAAKFSGNGRLQEDFASVGEQLLDAGLGAL